MIKKQPSRLKNISDNAKNLKLKGLGINTGAVNLQFENAVGIDEPRKQIYGDIGFLSCVPKFLEERTEIQQIVHITEDFVHSLVENIKYTMKKFSESEIEHRFNLYASQEVRNMRKELK